MFDIRQKDFLTIILSFECMKNGINRTYSNYVKSSMEKNFENLTLEEIETIKSFIHDFFNIQNFEIKNEFFKNKFISINKNLFDSCEKIELEKLMETYKK